MTDQGDFTETPNFVLRRTANTTLRGGRFYRPNNADVYAGAKLTIGDAGRPTILYRVDTSRIGRTITYNFNFAQRNKDDDSRN